MAFQQTVGEKEGTKVEVFQLLVGKKLGTKVDVFQLPSMEVAHTWVSSTQTEGGWVQMDYWRMLKVTPQSCNN